MYNRRSEPTHTRRASEQKLKEKNNRKPPSKRVNSTKTLPTSNWAKSDFISSIIEGVSNFVDNNLRDKGKDIRLTRFLVLLILTQFTNHINFFF